MKKMNMDNTRKLEKVSVINKSCLNTEFYFSSLVEEAYLQGLLNETAIEKIQMECLELLTVKTKQFNGDENCSIRIEIAENIMKSNLFVISVYLKTFSCPDDAVKLLVTQSISEIYNNGQKRIALKLKAVRHLYSMVLKNLIKTPNYTYNSTIKDGIKGFFKKYNPDFCADEIHITADYPLANPVKRLVGIEFIEKYLEAVYYENMFCKYFSFTTIHQVLYGFNTHYQELIFNLFEQVMTNAIGCVLAQVDILSLHLSIIDVEQIYDLLAKKSQEEIENIVVNSCYYMIKKLEITNNALQTYMKKSLHNIAVNIFNAVKIDKLERIFG